MNKRFLSASEVAEYLGLAKKTVQNQISNGKFPVGPSKRAAMDYLGKRKTQIRENRLWDKKAEFKKPFDEYAEDYLKSSRVQAYRSFKTERSRVNILKEFFSNVPTCKITPKLIDDYKA